MKKMRKFKKIMSLAAVFTAMTVMSAAAAAGAGAKEKEIGPGWESPAAAETAETGETAAAKPEIPAADVPPATAPASPAATLPAWLTEKTKDLVLVAADGPEQSACTVTYYEKDGDWKEIFSVRGDLGKAGVIAPEEKREGDKKTPLGVYRFTLAFGIKADPGSVMPYRQIRSGDFWVDDGASRYYNRLANISEVEKDWRSAENLAGMAPWYNYCLALSYNEEQTPGRGSAIFLHAKLDSDWGTSGCIGIPEENVKQLLKSVDENAKIVIISDKESK